MAARYCLEDIEPGSVTAYGGVTVHKDEMIAFARSFDPQPFHIDEAAARESFSGTLIASGWHTAALHQRMLCDAFLNEASCLGSPGVEQLQWLRPVVPGDRLTARRSVLERRVSRSKPDRGAVLFRFEVDNQRGETVLVQTNWILFAMRAPGSLPASDARGDALPPPPDTPPAPPLSDTAAFEDVPVGTVVELGRHVFSTDAIIDFARAFDPQDFHLDSEAAGRGPFGALSASGWHTAAAWMGCMARDRARRATSAEASGLRPSRLGPSPGFSRLRWLRPVCPGDELTYRSRMIDKRVSASRPGWGLVFHHNTGTNQRGETVFEFNGAVFWERRQP